MKAVLWLCVILSCCKSGSKKGETPAEYFYSNKVPKEIYQKKLEQITLSLKKMEVDKFPPFDIDKNGITGQTMVIDTIVFSPDRSRLVALILNKYNAYDIVVDKEGKESGHATFMRTRS